MIKQIAKKIIPPTVRANLKANYQKLQAENWLELRWYLSLQRIASLNRISRFKDKHLGERCFIIGNGPSLNKMDLSPLRNEFTFGLNRIYLLFPKLGFHTTYLVSVNQLVIEQCAEDLASLPMPKFISWRGIRANIESPKTIFIKTSYDVGFSDNPEKLVYESATVTNVALQLAYYMGFSEVILIGVDHSFVSKGKPNTTVVTQDSDPNHFDPNYFPKGFRWQLPDLERSELGYSLARETFIQEGKQILDATLGGKLQIFPKVNYAELFNKVK